MSENIVDWTLVSGTTGAASVKVAVRSNSELPRPIVLVVDDDRVVHLIAARVLSSMSVSVVHAHDGAEGLEMAMELKPDLILADALMPKLDGRELCRTIKNSPTMAGCKVAVMTALYKASRYRSEAFRTFLADEFIEKPLNPEKLRNTLCGLLGIPHATIAAHVPAGALAMAS